MASTSGDRSAQFPAIEKKHGKPIEFWIQEVKSLGDAKYPEQIAVLRERHGFSQAHANAVVMYLRGSTTSRRFADPEAYFTSLDATKQRTARAIFAAITAKFRELELVIAWNQPMLRSGTQYVFGISSATNHLLLAPMGAGVMTAFADRFEGYTANKKTVAVPVDWKVDKKLLCDLVQFRLDDLAAD